MNFFEFSVFAFHISTLAIMIYIVYVFNNQQLALRLRDVKVELTDKEFVRDTFEEPDSDEEEEFNPEKEEFTMVENPMLRHRKSQTDLPIIENID